MAMDHTTILFALPLAVALVCLVVYHLSLAAEERQLLRETSRFPLFMARDKLVNLVASSQMSDDDMAWRNAYRGVNSLLGLHQSLHLMDFMSRYAKHLSRLKTDLRYRQHFQTLLNVERQASDRIPAFADANKSIDDAFVHMVRKRTRAMHVVAVLFIVGMAIALRTMLTAGLHVATTAAFAIRKPERINARYFGV